ncbi:MAG: protein kinase [Gemmatimonadales bacterium]|nr:protein kinase [Gemmatimonadales bacterium]
MSDIQERLTAALAGRYDVEGPLGEGGMALVFLATDVKHDRQVAVKVLRPELAASLGAERFLREITVTAKLQHPHILPLYDSGDADGLLYYVMPFVEGESLADMIEREKQLSIDEAIRITKEVAGALGHAHSYGLIHRDIKPENIMMSGGHAIVADFGIAKAVSAAGGASMTQTGMAIGTPAYMSPEQAAGDPNLDGRTDIYALGCMLYETLIGQVPFTGPTAVAIIARHTMDQVPPPSIMRQSIPATLEDVIFCAMAKSPADRFRTAQEMIDALTSVETGGRPKVRSTRTDLRQAMIVQPPAWKRALLPTVSAVALLGVGFTLWQVFFAGGSGSGSVAGGLDPRNVAVLYFEDLTPDHELSYVTDGITEGLIDQLGTVGQLSVISRNGVEPFRDPAMARDSIARVLGAGSLVAGSVEPRGSTLRVTARLIDGTSGADVDRASFQVPAGDLLAARDSVVQTVSRFLRVRLGEEVRTRELRSETRSVEAWGMVQRAERLRKNAHALADAEDEAGVAAALAQADSLLLQAEAGDPRWAQPKIDRGWIAYDHARLLERGPAQVPWLDSAVARADAALAISANDARALELRGAARYRYWVLRVVTDPAEQERLLEEARDDLLAAVAADKTLANAYLTLTRVYYQFEDVPSALQAAEAAYEADAYLENADAVLDRLFWGSIDREFIPQARRWCTEGARRFPEDVRFLSCQLWLMTTPNEVADVGKAWQLRERVDSVGGALAQVQSELLVGGILARAGLADSASRVFDRAHSAITSEIDPNLELYPVEAYMRSLAGETDRAIDLLKDFTAANPTHDFSEMLGNWWWRNLRSSPRWKELSIG